MTKTITLKEYTCTRCNYSWLQRFADTPEPKNCASKKCKSPNWNKERKLLTTNKN